LVAPIVCRKRFLYFSIFFTVLGALISIYSTSHHLQLTASGSTDFSCNINDTFSCDSVARSSYSELFGVPLGVWGFGYFFSLLALLLLGRFVPKNMSESLQAYSVMVPIGVLLSVVLGGISVFSLGAFCISCIGVYLCCFALALLLYIDREGIPQPLSIKKIVNGGVVAGLLVIVSIFIFRSFVATGPNEVQENELRSLNSDPEGLLPNVFSIKIDKTNYSGYGVDYRKGGEDAKVVITEFADFQCPACSQASAQLKKIAQAYGDKVLIVFKNYPLSKKCNSGVQSDVHQFACAAALLARCAGEKGNFWKFHDQVFTNQVEMNEANLRRWAKDVGGLNKAEADQCLISKDVLAKIHDDINQGHQYEIDSTPTLYMNGQKYIGSRSVAKMSRMIDYLLNQ